MFNITQVQGIHDLVLKFNCKDTSKIFAGITTLAFQMIAVTAADYECDYDAGVKRQNGSFKNSDDS